MTAEELLESLKIDKLTNNLYLDGDLDVENNTEKNSREAILGANAKGTEEFSHLDPIPFINKLKQCYSDLTKTVAGTTSARTDSIKMNRDFMDYTGERGEDEEEETPEETAEELELKVYLELAEAMDLNDDGYVGLEESRIVLGIYLEEMMGRYNTEDYFVADSEYKNELVIPGYLNRVPIQLNGLYYYLVGEGNVSTFEDVRPYIYESPLENEKGYEDCTTLSELAEVLAAKISRIKEKTNVNAQLAARILSGVADYGNGIYMTYEQSVDWLKTFIEIHIEPEVDDRLMVNLLMPQYKRRVEVEDLDTNFWVIGTVLDALVQALWGNKGLVNLIEKMFAEVFNEINILLQKINIMEQVVGTGEAKSIVVNYLTGKYLSVYSNFAFSKIKTTISTDFGSRELSLPITFNNTLPNNLEIESFKDYCMTHNGSNLSEINAATLFYGKTNREMLAKRLESIRAGGDAVSMNTAFTSLSSNNPYVLNDNCHILLYDTTVYTFNSSTSELTVKAEKQSLYENLKIKINYGTAPVLCVPRSDIYNGEILLYSLSPNSSGKFPQLNNRNENEEMVMRTFSDGWEKLSLQNLFAQIPAYARDGRLGVQKADYETKQNLIVQYYQPSNKISESNAIYFITGLNPIITFNLFNPTEVTNINELFKLDITDSTTDSTLPVAINTFPRFYGEAVELPGINFQGSGTYVRNLVTMHKASEVLTNGSAISQGASTAGSSLFYSLGYAGGRRSGALLNGNITGDDGLKPLISSIENTSSGNFMNVLGAFWHYTNSVAFVILPNPITLTVKRPKIERVTFQVGKSFENRFPTNMLIYEIKYDSVDANSYLGNYDLLATNVSYKLIEKGIDSKGNFYADVSDINFSTSSNRVIGYMFIFYCTESEQVEVSNLKIYGTTGNGTDLYRP